jgi:hypothetical protein
VRHPSDAVDPGSELIEVSVEPVSVPEDNQLPVDSAIISPLTAELVTSLVEVFGSE